MTAERDPYPPLELWRRPLRPADATGDPPRWEPFGEAGAVANAGAVLGEIISAVEGPVLFVEMVDCPSCGDCDLQAGCPVCGGSGVVPRLRPKEN